MTASDFYALLTGTTPEIELRPGVWLTREGARFVISDALRSLVLAPHEQTFVAIANLVSRWPVPSCTG
jgi:hypothetical protein